MSARSLFLLLVLASPACSAGQAPTQTRAKPTIPAALHGCWRIDEPPDEEFPNGISETAIISADRLITQSPGVGRRVGTIEQVQRVTPTLIEGLISAREDGNQITLATMLAVGVENLAPGDLLLREGDAGSYHFQRCDAATQAALRYTLVIARTDHQDDPKPAPCGPDGSCGDSLYRARFHDARVIAGGDLPARFDARLKLHTPFISPTTSALIVERLPDGSLLVRRHAGFNGRTGIACFREPKEWPADWAPDVPQVHRDHGDLCVTDKSQIDSNAPKQ
jgi:hypothetical protein